MRYTKDIQLKKCITAKSHAFRLLEGVCITPSSCKMLVGAFWIRKERRFMEKKDNKKTETFLLRLPKEQKEKIFKVVQKSSYNNASEVIRAGIEKELNIQMNKDNMDFITKELSRLLDIKLDYFIKSQLKINSNNTRVNALNTYILGEVINLLTGIILANNSFLIAPEGW